MAKRRSDEGGRTAKPPRQHLYLILDDCSLGYSIRKIDLPSHSPPPNGALREVSIGAQLLPSPIIRVEAPRGLPMFFARAFGTKIMAMHPRDGLYEPNTHPFVPKHLVPAFDVRARAMVFVPRPEQDQMSYPCYIPIGNSLFALSESFQVLSSPQPDDDDDPTDEWCKLPDPPFSSNFVSSYAVHPDEQIIFISIGRLIAPKTFSFNMAQSEWTTLGGDWMLPFEGGAHFDAELNAWVGLSACPDHIGHLIACDVIPAGHGQCPAQKVSKENFFSQDPEEGHVGAKLLYMGRSSEFCLLECICIEDKHLAGRIYNYNREESPRYMFRVTTFSLKYDKNGDLTAGDSRQVRYYSVPAEATFLHLKYPLAFWM